MADSAHLLTDAGALGLAFFASRIATQPATRKMSYGFHRVEILAALINGVGLVTISLFLLKQAFVRFQTPRTIHTPLMLGLGVAGLLFNLFVAILLQEIAKKNVNARSAFFHVLSDLLGSLGVVAAALIVRNTGWYYADPLVSIVIAVLIVGGAWKILKDVVEVLLEATPARVNMTEMESRLLSVKGVREICDLHVWTISSGKEALSAHLVVNPQMDPATLLPEINTILCDEFDIQHTTIQFEKSAEKPHLPHQEGF